MYIFRLQVVIVSYYGASHSIPTGGKKNEYDLFFIFIFFCLEYDLIIAKYIMNQEWNKNGSLTISIA